MTAPRLLKAQALLVAWLVVGASKARPFSGEEAASFLNIPVGAAPAAMGGAYAALSNDAYGLVYNPGGLGLINTERSEAAIQHLEYLQKLNYEHLAIAIPLAEGHGLGITGQYFGSSDFDQTDETGQKIGKFSNNYTTFGLSYGYRFTDAFSLGATGKIIRGELATVSATSFASDFGFLYRANGWMSLGASLTNLGKSLKFSEQGSPLPRAARAGIAFHPGPSLRAAVDGMVKPGETTSVLGGLEWRPADIVALRVGYRSDNNEGSSEMSGLTAGGGFVFGGQEFDYAWLPLGNLGNTHYFSVLWRFGKLNY